MKDFAGKICFITGGASGAGLGQAKVFGREGMKVAIADIRQDALSSAVEELVDFGIKRENILAIKVDLTNREEYAAAADKVEEVFGGPPHLLIQTAGVNSFGPVEASTFDDFDWVMGVCLQHVVNGLVIFVSRMIKAYAHKTEFHVVTTSSMGGFFPCPGCGPYGAAKAAVNNLMYSYDAALRPYGAGATVLCPGNINSNIGNAEKYRPEHLRNTGYHVSEGTMMHLRSVHAGGIDPVELGEILKEAIENERVIAMPDRDYDNHAAVLHAMLESIADLALTRGQREKKAAERAAKQAANPDKHGPQIWAVPEGAEPFGQARKDLDWIDQSKRI
jgi:NAD(P)-dependent dehydrogenase (short-subunit alcohol dehydrogenase family)